MTPHQKIFAVAMSLALMLGIFELVRRRHLRIEYAWLWLVTGALVCLLVLRYDLLEDLTVLIGAVLPTTTLFIFALLFLMGVGLHFSVRISQLTAQLKNLAQEVAILRAAQPTDGGMSGPAPSPGTQPQAIGAESAGAAPGDRSI
jgi:hypothetical protein